MVMLTAACASAPAEIPSAKPSPSAAPTTIAPGVRVNPSQLRLPPYSVSSSYPLPAGTSAQGVATAFVSDNLIENVALERNDRSLLIFADTGALLRSEQQEIITNQSKGIKVLAVRDEIISLQLGTKPDPNDSSAVVAVIVQGTELQRRRIGLGAIEETTTQFDALLWMVWSPTRNQYLLCDTAES
jgi:hypothetical protein